MISFFFGLSACTGLQCKAAGSALHALHLHFRASPAVALVKRHMIYGALYVQKPRPVRSVALSPAKHAVRPDGYAARAARSRCASASGERRAAAWSPERAMPAGTAQRAAPGSPHKTAHAPVPGRQQPQLQAQLTDWKGRGPSSHSKAFHANWMAGDRGPTLHIAPHAQRPAQAGRLDTGTVRQPPSAAAARARQLGLARSLPASIGATAFKHAIWCCDDVSKSMVRHEMRWAAGGPVQQLLSMLARCMCRVWCGSVAVTCTNRTQLIADLLRLDASCMPERCCTPFLVHGAMQPSGTL